MKRIDDMLNSIIDECFLHKSHSSKTSKSSNNLPIENITADVAALKHVDNPPSEANLHSDEYNEFEQILENIDINFGTIEVTEKGVKVTGKHNQDVLATLTPCHGVTVFVNGMEVKGTVEVAEDDEISVQCHTETIPATVEAEVTEREAYLTIRAGKTVSHTLVTQPAQRDVTLQTNTDAKAAPFSEEQIYQCLQQSGVKYGINHSLLQEIISNQSEGRFLIATAKDPTPPVDDYITVVFRENEQLRHQEKLNRVKIDINSINCIPSVESGAVLAVRKPGRPGIPGVSVTGQAILPPEPKKIKLLAGKGTALINQGNVAIATKAGRPVIRQGISHCK